MFKCWVCDYAGNKISSILKSYGRERLSCWNTLSGEVDLTKYENIFEEQEKKEIKKNVCLPEGFKTLTGEKTPLKKKPLEYLYARNITDLDILRWKIGFCDFGKYERRIIVPSFDMDGVLDYYVARSYDHGSYKYKNPQISKDIIFNDLSIDWSSPVTLVEGVFDAIKCENSIPLLGSTLPEASKIFQKILIEKPIIYLALDADARDKQYKISNMLLQYNIKIKFIDSAPYSDLAEMPRAEIKIRKQKALFIHETDYLKYKLEFL